MSYHLTPIELPVTDEQNDERHARNLIRAQEAIAALGPRWVGWLPSKADGDSLAPLLIASIELARAKKAQK